MDEMRKMEMQDAQELAKTYESLDKNGKEIITALAAGLLSRQRMDEQKAV